MSVRADFMACHLIRPASGVFCLGSGKTLDGFQLCAFIAGAGSAGGEFQFVMLEVIIHAAQFAAEVLFLSGADGCKSALSWPAASFFSFSPSC